MEPAGCAGSPGGTRSGPHSSPNIASWYDAIASGDPDRARAVALGHVQTNYRSTVRHLIGEDAAR